MLYNFENFCLHVQTPDCTIAYTSIIYLYIHIILCIVYLPKCSKIPTSQILVQSEEIILLFYPTPPPHHRAS